MAGGITNAQARYMANLCRQIGAPYFGQGLSMQEASKAIDQLREAVALEDARKRRLAAAGGAAGRPTAPKAGTDGRPHRRPRRTS